MKNTENEKPTLKPNNIQYNGMIIVCLGDKYYIHSIDDLANAITFTKSITEAKLFIDLKKENND